MNRTLAITAALSLAACTEAELNGWSDTNNEAYLADPVLRIDVYPSSADYTADVGDGLDLLPTTFDVDVAELEGGSTDLDLVLAAPVVVTGSVTGYRVTPQALTGTGLPGSDEAVLASLTLRKADTIQTRTALTGEDGTFAVEAAPDEAYRLIVVPDDTDFPLYTEEVDLLDAMHIDLDLGAGSAVWGQVRAGEATPLEGVEVYVQSVFGGHSNTVVTDLDGGYQLRVSPGAYQVIASGGDSGRDPTVPSAEVFVGEEGRRVDITYPNLDFQSVGGRIVVSTGDVLQSGAMARITAVSIDDYPEGASVEIEVPADPFGNFDTRLLRGTYDVELIPAEAQQLSPVRIEGVRVDGATELGSISLPVMNVAFGSVSDPEGDPVADALIDCVEIGFGQRRFSAYSDASGQFGLLAPNVPLSCRLVPAATRTDLAMTRREVDLSVTPAPALVMEYGQRITGTVRYDDGALRPLEFAVVEVRDTKGQLLGTTVTTSGGGFSLRVTAAE